MHTASPGRLWPKRDGIVCPSAKASASVPGPAPMQTWATYDHDWHYQQRRGDGREEQDAVDVEVSKKPRFRRAAPYSRSERFIRAAWHHAWGGGRKWQAHNGPGLDHSHAPYRMGSVCVYAAGERGCVCVHVCACVRACVRWSGGEGRRKVACMGPKQMLRRAPGLPNSKSAHNTDIIR